MVLSTFIVSSYGPRVIHPQGIKNYHGTNYLVQPKSLTSIFRG
jgi:hypothetical protein